MSPKEAAQAIDVLYRTLSVGCYTNLDFFFFHFVS